MNFLNADFVILLSFLIFIGLCWRHLAKPTATLLDQQIQTVQQDIHVHAQAYAAAKEGYAQAQQYSEQVHRDIIALHERTQTSLEKIKVQAQEQLTFLMMLKDKAYQSKIEQLDHKKMHWLKVETAQHTIAAFQKAVQQEHVTALTLLTDQMVERLERAD